MYINVSEELRELAEIFERNGEQLYIVGGHVRDAILGINGTFKNDVDLCSACKPDKVVKILSKTRFSTDNTNAKYGTIIIDGFKRYEHTTFRRENYNLNGEHNPTGVEFIKDIKTDALRRDFTINAVYYNILTSEVVDPVGGVEDINKGIIATTNNSDATFSEDAERILRMIRFACVFNFQIEEKTLLSAIKFYKGVGNLSKTRIRAELEKMLVCDTFYPQRKECKYAHAKCMILLGKLDLWQYVLPAVEQIQKGGIIDEKGEDLYCHIINTISVCDPEVRLACLLHDVGKTYTKTQKNNFAFNQDWADIIIENNLGVDGLYYPKKTIEETKAIIKALDWDRYGYKPTRQVKRFIRDNKNIFESICKLKNAIALENTEFTTKSKIAERWKYIYNRMKKNNTPMSLKELNITGSDIIDCVPDIKLERIGELLNKMLDFCLYHPRCNHTEILAEKVKKIVLKNPNYYFD